MEDTRNTRNTFTYHVYPPTQIGLKHYLLLRNYVRSFVYYSMLYTDSIML